MSIPAEREYKNKCESDFMLLAIEKGWQVSKRGWPDFFCTSKDGERFAVECKPRLSDGLKHKLLTVEQAIVMDCLECRGIRCYISDGKTLERFKMGLHADQSRRRNGNGNLRKVLIES